MRLVPSLRADPKGQNAIMTTSSIDSSAISAVGYDPLNQHLHIRFRSGRTYTFYRVPPAIYHGLLNASSAGQYYHAYIRGRFGP